MALSANFVWAILFFIATAVLALGKEASTCADGVDVCPRAAHTEEEVERETDEAAAASLELLQVSRKVEEKVAPKASDQAVKKVLAKQDQHGREAANNTKWTPVCSQMSP